MVHNIALVVCIRLVSLFHFPSSGVPFDRIFLYLPLILSCLFVHLHTLFIYPWFIYYLRLIFRAMFPCESQFFADSLLRSFAICGFLKTRPATDHENQG
jgi:hypothetical protein